jgi:hypothetical protein
MSWDNKAPEPEWIARMSDQELVQHFKNILDSRRTHESVGRDIRAARKRLYKILLDGLSAAERKAI